MENLLWKKFWKLLVLEYLYKDKHYNSYWKCKCDCWNEIITRPRQSKSCWCLQKEFMTKKFKKHWMSYSKLYRVWCTMRARCSNIKNISYKNYWGRWITYSSDWNYFKLFYKDMINTYREWLEIDRIDNNWNYCKENCRWVTHKENNNNRRNNIALRR